MINYNDLAKLVMARLEELGNISQSTDYLDRRYLTPEHRQANRLVAGWMGEAGMISWEDQAGNLWGRYECLDPNAPRFILGSHLDTVPNGGKYDGMLGVVAPISLVHILKVTRTPLPFHLDIVGFGDEEGTRFGSTLLGSKALTGRWPDEWAKLKDENGISLPEALKSFGLNFDNVPQASVVDTGVLGYLELHIEQGPVLEKQNLPVGVVSAISGARRFDIAVTGMAGHAGTVPMALRQDALVAASEMVLTVETLAREHNVVATVGKIENKPNGVNVISGRTQLSLDIRSENDAHRDAVLEQIVQSFHQIAARRQVGLVINQTHTASAVQCDHRLQSILKNAISECGIPTHTLPSGAGHDAMAMARLCPVAMLFLRCDRGISHHPAEAIKTDDVAVALATLHSTIKHLAH
ncbi:allantoate amidohydrolase [Aestuariibacter sp. A3R04]|uniref:allantoate amidohydrolase n=1 Tax=Aestuariibacter sp. A3R04 TaxID=2841571 RepID=UPI001C09C132|nr:allantoate amidohydrolase [Aestuariibacter sp. A3R04]MBU3022637.1 allantoate amidohydrolase [Aestuariibacter sp. A3R04]